jgi:cold shock CspA family protein
MTSSPSNGLPTDSPTKLTGAIRKLGKGFGFIAGDDGQDYFFHWTSVEGDMEAFGRLVLKNRVMFVRRSSPRGERALEVVVIPKPSEQVAVV